MAIIDVSLPLHVGCPHWPGDAPFTFRRTASMDEGGACNVGEYGGSAHLGTHADAPCHFVPDGASIDRIDPGIFIGAATVVDIQVDADITAADLDAAIAHWPERLLIRTRNSAPGGVLDRGEPSEGFCGLTADAAELAADRNVKLIGIDSWSIGAATESAATHRCLLAAGVVVLEGLDLRAVQGGLYGLIAPPIKLAGSDGAPVRALLTDAPPPNRR